MGLFVFFIVFIAVSIFGTAVYLIYLPFKIYFKRSGKLSDLLSRKINRAYLCILLITILAITYTELFPDESFYEDEFKTVTNQEFPESAEFISKSASYPDFHGDYCSSSVIQLSKKDYQKLYKSINNEPEMKVNENKVSFQEQQKPKSKLLKSFVRQLKDKPDHYLNIQFYSDLQTISVNICVS